MNTSSNTTVFEMVGARFTQTLKLQQRGDAVLFRTSMASGKAVPLHSHIDPEGIYILSGAMEVFLMDENPAWHLLNAGESLLIEDGLKHAMRNNSGEPADLIVMTNGRLAEYFHRVGRPAEGATAPAAPTQDGIQHMLMVTKEFGYWIASPEESESATNA